MIVLDSEIWAFSVSWWGSRSFPLMSTEFVLSSLGGVFSHLYSTNTASESWYSEHSYYVFTTHTEAWIHRNKSHVLLSLDPWPLAQYTAHSIYHLLKKKKKGNRFLIHRKNKTKLSDNSQNRVNNQVYWFCIFHFHPTEISDTHTYHLPSLPYFLCSTF